MSLKDKQQKDVATFVFNGFCEILLNNMNALYEGDKWYLDKLFATKRTTSDLDDYYSTENFEDPKFIQNTYYPKLLNILLKVKSGLQCFN